MLERSSLAYLALAGFRKDAMWDVRRMIRERAGRVGHAHGYPLPGPLPRERENGNHLPRERRKNQPTASITPATIRSQRSPSKAKTSRSAVSTSRSSELRSSARA